MSKSETEEQLAHRIYKSWCVGLLKEDDITNDQLILLYRHYPFIFTPYQKFLMKRWLQENGIR
jgi:hypothetical protein